MKRSKKKLEVMKASGLDISKTPPAERRSKYFARLRRVEFMRSIARKGALATNAKRKAQQLAATG